MKKLIFTTLSLTIFIGAANAQAWNKLKEKAQEKIAVPSTKALSEEEVAKGLKEALNKGIEKGVEKVSKPDGFFKDPEIKIPFPEDAKVVETKLRKVGQGKKCDEVILTLNRAAEDASKSAKEIFIVAIKNMTISDAFNILKGEDNAATEYLKKSTSAKLKEKFKPIIQASLDKVGATKHWETVMTTYNKIPMVKKVNPDLAEYVTDKAITGLFLQIEKEEKEIRKNPMARTSDILKKVFKEQD